MYAGETKKAYKLHEFKFNEEDDGKYALTLDNINKLDACEFDGDKHPVSGESCQPLIENMISDSIILKIVSIL